MKRIVSITAVAAACVAPAAASAVVAPSPPSGSVTLNSHSSRGTPSAKTSFELPKHVWYVVTVSGTMSYYPPKDYKKPERPYNMICGTPQMSHGLPVGLDAEFTFARPWLARPCAKAHLPIHWENFQAFLPGWAHPQVLGNRPTVPTADHTYQYVLRGRNKPARFRLVDSYYGDNYGSLSISLRPANKGDCASYWSFKFRSSAVCVAALPAAPLPVAPVKSGSRS